MTESFGEGYHSRNGLIHSIERVAETLLVKESIIYGEENLFTMRRLLREGKNIIMMPNHLANIDGHILEGALISSGFSDLAEKSVPAVGAVLTDNPISNFMLQGSRRFIVSSFRRPPKTKEERTRRLRVLRQSIVTVRTIFENGYIFVIFAEGTRSRNGQMGEALKNVGIYLTSTPKEDTYVQPIAITGSNNIHRVDAKLPRRGNVSVNFGELIPVSELDTQTVSMGRIDKRNEMVEIVMRHIAGLLPEAHRGVYSETAI